MHQVTGAGVSVSRSKAKGTAAETATVLALRELGFPHAERRALAGALDLGDITGTPGICWEVKDARTWKAAEWLSETETERINARADYGILVIKVAGVGYQNASRWLTVMELGAAIDLFGGVPVELFRGEQPPTCRWVKMKAVGIHKGLEELKERERHCGDTPVHVTVKMRESENNRWINSSYSLMRLDERCKLLVAAGYGGIVTRRGHTLDIMREYCDG